MKSNKLVFLDRFENKVEIDIYHHDDTDKTRGVTVTCNEVQFDELLELLQKHKDTVKTI